MGARLKRQTVRLARNLGYAEWELHHLRLLSFHEVKQEGDFFPAPFLVRILKTSMRNRIGIFSLISLTVALLLFWLFYPTEEEQILARFEELSDIASKSDIASAIADALVLEDFRDIFAPQVYLKTGGRARLAGQYTDRELMQLYGRIRLQSKRLSLRFENIEILSLSETDATTTADVHAEGTDNIRASNRVESFHAKINLRKIDGDWKFRQFIYIEPLPGK